jgi:hypothetical protein
MLWKYCSDLLSWHFQNQTAGILPLEIISFKKLDCVLCVYIIYTMQLYYFSLKCINKRRRSFQIKHWDRGILVSRRSTHRNQTISRKGANIISRRPSHGHLARLCCPQAFLGIFSEVTYIRTVGNSTLLKIYTLPNHTITIGVCILETQLLGLLYGGGASFVQKWSMPWMSANI